MFNFKQDKTHILTKYLVQVNTDTGPYNLQEDTFGTNKAIYVRPQLEWPFFHDKQSAENAAARMNQEFKQFHHIIDYLIVEVELRVKY